MCKPKGPCVKQSKRKKLEPIIDNIRMTKYMSHNKKNPHLEIEMKSYIV